MKINTISHLVVYDIVNHMRKRGMPDEMAEYLYSLLEDNIPIFIKIDGILYETPYKYWLDYVNAFGTCCGMCNEDTLAEVDRCRELVIKHGTRLKNGAIEY